MAILSRLPGPVGFPQFHLPADLLTQRLSPRQLSRGFPPAQVFQSSLHDPPPAGRSLPLQGLASQLPGLPAIHKVMPFPPLRLLMSGWLHQITQAALAGPQPLSPQGQ